MPIYCTAATCNQQRGNKVPMFRFPKDKERCLIWKKALGVTGKHPYADASSEKCHNNLRVCSLHFDQKYLTSMKTKLKKGAVPYVSREKEDYSVNDCDEHDLPSTSSSKFFFSELDGELVKAHFSKSENIFNRTETNICKNDVLSDHSVDDYDEDYLPTSSRKRLLSELRVYENISKRERTKICEKDVLSDTMVKLEPIEEVTLDNEEAMSFLSDSDQPTSDVKIELSPTRVIDSDARLPTSDVKIELSPTTVIKSEPIEYGEIQTVKDRPSANLFRLSCTCRRPGSSIIVHRDEGTQTPKRLNRSTPDELKYKAKIKYLQRQLEKQIIINKMEKKTESKDVLNYFIERNSSTIFIDLLNLQIDGLNKNRRGLRYSEEMKQFASTLYSLSPACYSHFSIVFQLPGVSTLNHYRSEVEKTQSTTNSEDKFEVETLEIPETLQMPETLDIPEILDIPETLEMPMQS